MVLLSELKDPEKLKKAMDEVGEYFNMETARNYLKIAGLNPMFQFECTTLTDGELLTFNKFKDAILLDLCHGELNMAISKDSNPLYFMALFELVALGKVTISERVVYTASLLESDDERVAREHPTFTDEEREYYRALTSKEDGGCNE